MSSTFPTHLVPEGIFRDYIKFQETNSEGHPAYHFGSMLSAASLMLGHDCYFQNGPHKVRPNMYTLIVGRSGFSRKSSSVQPIMNIIEKVNTNYLLEGNFSSESLIQLFRAQSERLLFLDEVRHIFEQSRKSFGTGVLTNITKLFNCPSSLRSEYKSSLDDNGDINEENIALDPYLCILGLTTIDWLEASDQDIMGGFLGRFFPIKVKDQFRQWIPNPKWDDSLEFSILRKFHELKGISGRFTWSEEAQSIWNTYYIELMECAANADHYQSGSFGSRLGDYLIKLSMIFNAIQYGTKEIQPNSIVAAKKFVDLAFSHHIELLESFGTTQFAKDIVKISSIIAHKGGKVEHSYLLKYSKLQAKDLAILLTTMTHSERIGKHIDTTLVKPKQIYYDPNQFMVSDGHLVSIHDSHHNSQTV